MSIGFSERPPLPMGRLVPNAEAQAFFLDTIRQAPRILPKKVKALPRRSPNNRRFRNLRKRNQLIGDCAGESFAAMGETTIRTPDNFTDEDEPLDPIDLSALWCYYISRKACTENGISGIMQGEGSLVNMTLIGAKKYGLRKLEDWPSTKANYDNYYKQERTGKPPQACIDAEPINLIDDIASLLNPDQILEYLSQGYSVNVGTVWPSNAFNADSEGRFSWSGSPSGGHAWELLDYDQDKDLAWCGNSWDQSWGVNPGCIGVTKLSSLMREFSEKKLRSGETEASVSCGVEGFEPKFLDPHGYL
jgi:hypothetical protein